MGLAFPLSLRWPSRTRLLSWAGGPSGVPDVTPAKIPASSTHVRAAGAISRVRDAGRFGFGFVLSKSSPTSSISLCSSANDSDASSSDLFATSTPSPPPTRPSAPISFVTQNSASDGPTAILDHKFGGDAQFLASSIAYSALSFRSSDSFSDEEDTDSDSGSDYSIGSSLASSNPSVLERVFPDCDFANRAVENVYDTLWDGSILDESAITGERTLYIEPTDANVLNINENIIDLIEQADEEHGCTGLVICLNKSCSNIANVVHSLMYAGGVVVSQPPFAVNPEYILIGISL